MNPINLITLPPLQPLVNTHRRNAPVARGHHHLLERRIPNIPYGEDALDVSHHLVVDHDPPLLVLLDRTFGEEVGYGLRTGLVNEAPFNLEVFLRRAKNLRVRIM